MPNSEFNINNTELDQQYHYGSDWIVMPMMPLRGTLVFPHVVTHLDVGRDRSLNAINDAMEGDANYLFLAMQKDPQLEEPLLGEIYEVGTVVKKSGSCLNCLVELCACWWKGFIAPEGSVLSKKTPISWQRLSLCIVFRARMKLRKKL